MVIFQRSSLSTAQDAGSDSQQGSAQQAPHRSSLISARHGSSSMSFRHHSGSSRYSSTAFEAGITNEVNVPNSRLSRFLCGCCGGTVKCRKPACMAPHSSVSVNSKKIIRSRAWKLLMIFFYSFVLFGSQVYYLLAPAKDTAFNIMALVTFGFCVLEITLRIMAEPNYFQFGITSFFQSKKYNIGGGGGGNDNNSNTTCVFGSFLFWCDVVSTVATLYDVTWTNFKHFEQPVIEIELDMNGFPVRTFVCWFFLSFVMPIIKIFATKQLVGDCAHFILFLWLLLFFVLIHCT